MGEKADRYRKRQGITNGQREGGGGGRVGAIADHIADTGGHIYRRCGVRVQVQLNNGAGRLGLMATKGDSWKGRE